MPFRPLLVALLALSAQGVSLSLAAQNMPPLPIDPPPDRVLIDDMWVPTWALSGDGNWDGPTWTGGVVPYSFDSATVSAGERNKMLLAMAELEAVCGVDFVPWTNTSSVIVIRENPEQSNVSNSEVGMQVLPQYLNVGSDHWDSHFTHVHELMHALGFKHEQQRPDRDLYVTIKWDNIKQYGCGGGPCNGNFAISNSQTVGPYDFESVMHYRGKAFGIGGATTIECKPGFEQFQNVIGNAPGLSYGDAQALQSKYGLPAGPVITSHVPGTIMAGTGSIQVHVNGTGFLRGSSDPVVGVHGSRVQFLSGNTWVNLSTSVESGTKLIAYMDIPVEFPVGALSFRVRNDALAGGSSNVVTSTVNPPPCASADEWTGHAVLGMPDIDGDGHEDCLLARPGYNFGRGQVACRSGADGSVLWIRNGLVQGGNVGYALAAIGDITGDGITEVASGAPGAGSGTVHILNGVNGFIVRTIDASSFGSGPAFGSAVSAAGDLNLDGTPDLVVGSPEANAFTGRIELISGANGVPFFSIAGVQAGERFGTAVSGGVDLTGDGRPEVVVGAPLFDGANGINCGRFSIYQAAFGTWLVSAVGDGPGDHLGRSVVIAKSTTGDKLGCVVAGAPEVGSHGTNVGTGYVRGYRYVSGPLVGLATLFTWSGGLQGGQRGWRVVSAGDVDDDGGTDFLFSAPGSATVDSVIELRSGRSGELLWRTDRQASTDRTGWALAVADTSGNQTPNAIIGIPFYDGQCPDSGAWSIGDIRVRPAADRLMITEVAAALPPQLPAAVELTNFSSVAIDLSEWTVRWRDNFPSQNTSGPLSMLNGIVILPHETIVLRTALGGSYPETPPSVRTFPVLAGGSILATDFCVGLIAPNGYVVDEVRAAGTSGYFEGSFGGKFRGSVHNHQSPPFVFPIYLERIWGLDSNGATDWTVSSLHSIGLENMSAGSRDRRRLSFDTANVKINEISTGAVTYIELVNRDIALVDLQGWSLRYSPAHGAPVQELLRFAEKENLLVGDFVVVGTTAQPPVEQPASAAYFRVNGPLLGGNEFAVGLYDAAGHLIDLVRVGRVGSAIEHNDPRLPSHADDFRLAAEAAPPGMSLGRTAASDDHDVGADWLPFATRTMGFANPVQAVVPDPTEQMDVRLNNGPGAALSILIDAGSDHAGEQWGFKLKSGHGPSAGNGIGFSLLSFDSGDPIFGMLGNRGVDRRDFDASLVPAGLQLDFVFFLLDPADAAFTSWTKVLMFDS